VVILLDGASCDSVCVNCRFGEGDNVDDFSQARFRSALSVLSDGEQDLKEEAQRDHDNHRDRETVFSRLKVTHYHDDVADDVQQSQARPHENPHEDPPNGAFQQPLSDDLAKRKEPVDVDEES